jgi:DNA-directed RNA polymerase specialized sigma24 family protein
VAAHLAQHLRRDLDSDRLYERHAPTIYRYALAVLGDPDDAATVTRATFAGANRALERGARPLGPTGTWLLRIAHALCRKQAGYDESVVDELAEADGDAAGMECGEFEALIYGELDGKLSRGERHRLHAHLRSCAPCRAHALRQRALRAAVRALAAVPLPRSLA